LSPVFHPPFLYPPQGQVSPFRCFSLELIDGGLSSPFFWRKIFFPPGRLPACCRCFFSFFFFCMFLSRLEWARAVGSSRKKDLGSAVSWLSSRFSNSSAKLSYDAAKNYFLAFLVCFPSLILFGPCLRFKDMSLVRACPITCLFLLVANFPPTTPLWIKTSHVGHEPHGQFFPSVVVRLLPSESTFRTAPTAVFQACCPLPPLPLPRGSDFGARSPQAKDALEKGVPSFFPLLCQV